MGVYRPPMAAVQAVGDGRPRSRMTPRVRRDVLIDRTAFQLVASMATQPAPEILDRVIAEVDEALPLFEDRGWIADPATYHVTPPRPEGIRTRSRTSGRLRYTTMTWSDGYEPRPEEPGAARYAAYRENRIARAAVLEHRTGDRPWLICVHGFGMGSPALDLRALRALQLHRELGLNVAFPTLPLHGRRKMKGSRLGGFPGVDMLDNAHGLSQAVWDVRQLLAHLRERTDAPIGMMGFSLGGGVTALTASLDEVDAALLLAPAVDLATLMIDAAEKATSAATLGSSEGMRRAAPLLDTVAPLRMTPRVRPERAFISAPTLDRFARPTTQAVALWRHWGEPELHWLHGGHVGLVLGKGVQPAIHDSARTGPYYSPENHASRTFQSPPRASPPTSSPTASTASKPPGSSARSPRTPPARHVRCC